MWYILVEIDALPQIEKIEPDLAENITAQIGRTLAPPLFRFIGRRGGVHVFTAKGSGKENERIAEQLKRTESFLRSQPEAVESFSVVVRGDADIQQLGSEPLLGDAVRFVYDVPEEVGLWCDESASRKLFSGVGLQRREIFSRYISESMEIGRERAELREYFESLLPIEEVFDEFTPILNGVEESVFLLRGPEGSGKRSLFERLRATIQGSTLHLPWLEFADDYPGYGSFELLLRSLNEDFIEKIPSYVNRHEGALWKTLRPLLAGDSATIVRNDALLILDLYLSAYVRYMESMYFPPVVYVYDIDTMPQPAISLIKEMIDRPYPGKGVLWIISSERGDVLEGTRRSVTGCDLLTHLASLRDRKLAQESWWASEREINGESLPLYTAFHAYLLSSFFNRETGSADSPTEILLEELSGEERSLLYGISLLPQELDQSSFEDLLGRTGMDQEDVARSLDRLSMYRLVHPEHHLLPLFPDLYLSKGAGDRERELSLREGAIEILRDTGLRADSPLSHLRRARALERLGSLEEAIEHYFRAAAQMLFYEAHDELRGLVDRIEEKLSNLRGGTSIFRERLEGLRLHMAIAEGDRAEADRRFALISTEHREARGEHEERLYAKWVFTRGEYFWRSRRYTEALKETKDALLRFQSLALPEWEVKAQLLLGKIMLSFQRVEEAVEYFHNAGQRELDDIYYSLICESAAFVVLTHVMLGDYSLALSYADGAGKRAAAHGRRSWERYLEMLRGKLLCELGRYSEASKLFQSLLLHERLYFDKEREGRFIAWISRCLMYQGFTETALERLVLLEESSEQLYFRAEASLLQRDFESALQLLDRALEIDNGDEDFIPPITLLSRDGYEPFENLVLKKPGAYDVLYQLIRAMRGFVLSRLGSQEEADLEFDAILEAEKRVKMDPYRHLYYFFRTLAFENGDQEGELTKATFLSKAFQNLQKIAGRITEPSDRRSFLKENYWNSKLFAMSKEHKLV